MAQAKGQSWVGSAVYQQCCWGKGTILLWGALKPVMTALLPPAKKKKKKWGFGFDGRLLWCISVLLSWNTRPTVVDIFLFTITAETRTNHKWRSRSSSLDHGGGGWQALGPWRVRSQLWPCEEWPSLSTSPKALSGSLIPCVMFLGKSWYGEGRRWGGAGCSVVGWGRMEGLYSRLPISFPMHLRSELCLSNW